MFKISVLKNKNDYFFTKSERSPESVYFCRFIGYDDETLYFYSHYYHFAVNGGIYINNKIVNPTEEEVDLFYKLTGNCDIKINYDSIINILEKLFTSVSIDNKKLLADSILHQFRLITEQNVNLSDSVLKNIFIKLLCWIKFRFEFIINKKINVNIPKILYDINISKHELYLLNIFALYGFDVLIVNFEEDNNYNKIDKDSNYAKSYYYKKLGMPNVDFKKLDWQFDYKYKNLVKKVSEMDNVIQTNLWVNGDVLDESLKKSNQRDNNKICNIFVSFSGIDEKEKYLNKLYSWKTKLISDNRNVVIVDKRISNPTNDEVMAIRLPECINKDELMFNMLNYINFNKDDKLNLLLKKSFIQVLDVKEDSVQKIKNKGVCIICWLKRYGSTLFQNFNMNLFPTFIYNGSCNKNEALFLTFLSQTPVDVFNFCTDLNIQNEIITDSRILNIKLDNSMEIEEFPKKERKLQETTVAYEAERELTNILYSDSGLFKNMQFNSTIPVTLTTTYDEINILWKQQAKYRPAFEVRNNMVLVPTIFAKISGVKNGNINNYIQEIKSKVTDDTILFNKVPIIKETDFNPFKQYAVKFFSNRKILTEKIKNHAEYKYNYLSDDVQNYIFDKIQKLIDLNWIKINSQGIEYLILSTLLNLEKSTVRLIQKFDFTKDIPKLIIVNTKETICSVEDCIYIAFLNLIGFDIIVYVPTGFSVFEKYLVSDIFREYKIGDYLFDIEISLNELSGGIKRKNIFDKLLGKGWF